MSSSTAVIDFESIEAQLREEAERKVSVLREIVATHTAVTSEREKFLADDADRVRALSALLAEAKSSGFDSKTLKSFEVDHLVTAKQAGSPRRTRRVSSPKPAATTTAKPVAPPAESVSA